MGEIADDHFVEIYWNEGTGIGADGGFGPPCDRPEYGGMNAYIARQIRVPVNTYRCKFCGNPIGFIRRLPYNRTDGTPHRCLADKAAALREKQAKDTP